MSATHHPIVFRAVLAVAMLFGASLASAQVTGPICNNLFSPNGPNQPAAHYVGDYITLQVDRTSLFNFIYGNTNTFLGQGTIKTVVAPGPGTATLAAQTVPGSAWGNCELTTFIYPDLVAQISSISGDRVVVNELTFSGSSSGGAGGNTYLWNFGDGTTSTARNTTHSYNEPGTYQVQFVVTDRFDRSSAKTQSITIGNNPNVPGKPANIFHEYLGCPSGHIARYFFSWQSTGSQPGNYHQLQKKVYYANWGLTYSGTGNVRLQSGFLRNQYYNVRIRNCVTSNSETCGPWATVSFRVRNCGGPGGHLD